MTGEPRTVQLRKWMATCNVTYRWIGEQLGISNTAARSLLIKDTVPVERYHQLAAIGVPVHLLPVAMDIPTGPARREPTFSALSTR